MERDPIIGIVMGSDSDWPIMKAAGEVCDRFEVPWQARVLSAHRTPAATADFASGAAERGMKVLIAGAGGAAHLAGVVAAHTLLPVVGVPIPTPNLQGLDSLLSTVQMPKGVPVATVGIGRADNAALLAMEILAVSDGDLRARLSEERQKMRQRVEEADGRIQSTDSA